MQFPKLFGNRKARRAAAKRGAPTLGELPAEMQQLVQMVAQCQLALDVMRSGTFSKPAGQVHGVMEWLNSMRTAGETRLRAHPQFSTFFPDEAPAAGTIVVPGTNPVLPNGEQKT